MLSITEQKRRKYAYAKKREAEHREWAIKLLGGKCARCGVSESLQFDHIDNNSVTFRIGNRLTYSKKNLETELKKCQLLCIPCHKEKTIEDMVKDKRWGGIKHGSLNYYSNHKCRCTLCCDYGRAYARKRRLIRKARAGATG